MDIDEEPIEGIKGLLIYKIDSDEYCADIRNVIAIVEADLVKQNIKNNISNHIEYNHHIFTMIDLHKIFKKNPIKHTKNIRIIMHEMYGKRYCFFVDKVLEILSIDNIFFEKSLDILPCTRKNFIKYILRFQERDILIPDFEKITKSLYKLNEFHKIV